MTRYEPFLTAINGIIETSAPRFSEPAVREIPEAEFTYEVDEVPIPGTQQIITDIRCDIWFEGGDGGFSVRGIQERVYHPKSPTDPHGQAWTEWFYIDETTPAGKLIGDVVREYVESDQTSLWDRYREVFDE